MYFFSYSECVFFRLYVISNNWLSFFLFLLRSYYVSFSSFDLSALPTFYSHVLSLPSSCLYFRLSLLFPFLRPSFRVSYIFSLYFLIVAHLPIPQPSLSPCTFLFTLPSIHLPCPPLPFLSPHPSPFHPSPSSSSASYQNPLGGPSVTSEGERHPFSPDTVT